MDRSDVTTDQVRALREANHERMQQAIRANPDPTYRLRAPWLSPCALAEAQVVDGSLQTVTLVYGSWETGRPHVRVTTWRELPGQDFVPDAPVGFLGAPSEQVTVDVEGKAHTGTLARLPGGSWLLRVDTGGGPHLMAWGHGPAGELSFDALSDFEPAIEARRAYLASVLPEG
jgi:hypothetical protein